MINSTDMYLVCITVGQSDIRKRKHVSPQSDSDDSADDKGTKGTEAMNFPLKMKKKTEKQGGPPGYRIGRICTNNSEYI